MEEVVKIDGKGHLERWHNIGESQAVKKSITYREITVAIGIIVALVIALTLWIRVPEEKVSGRASAPKVGLSSPVQNVFKATIRIFSNQEF